MKRNGTTSSGSVVVEMTAAQFDVLSRRQKASPTEPTAETMSLADRVTYVRDRIVKLKPKKREGVAHSISAMFQFTGGIAETDIEEIIARLQRENHLIVDEAGRVTYSQGLTRVH
jgi:hypothetical protein